MYNMAITRRTLIHIFKTSMFIHLLLYVSSCVCNIILMLNTILDIRYICSSVINIRNTEEAV